MQMKAAYMPFYLEGVADEEDTEDLSGDESLDVEKLAERALAGPDDVHTVISNAVKALAAPLEHGTDKRDWIADHKDEIKDAGGDADEAYRHYCKGCIDEAVLELTNEVIEEMMPADDEGDDNDDDDKED